MNVANNLLPEEFRASVTKPLVRFYTITVLSCVGNGLTLSLFVVYLHNVRHLSIGFATLVLAATAILGLAISPLLGTLVDRFGPTKVIVPSFIGEALGLVLWAFVHTKAQVVGADFVLTVFGGAYWGAGTTLLSRLVTPEQRQRAFGINFMLVNLGIGFGALISAAIVDLHHPATFSFLYLANAGVCLVIAGMFMTLWHHGGAQPTDHLDDDTREQGWREVLRDKRLVRFVIASLVMLIGGYGSQDAGFSVFVVNNLHLPVHVIGLIFFFNTTTIVAAQLFVLKRIEGRSRTRVMAIVGVMWFVFWIVLDLALKLPAVLAVTSMCLAMVVFAIGETMMSPVGPAIVNELAPEHLRGRYNAMSGLTWGVSSTVASTITALFFSKGWGDAWPLFVGCAALVGSVLMLNLRRSLTSVEDGRVSTDESAA